MHGIARATIRLVSAAMLAGAAIGSLGLAGAVEQPGSNPGSTVPPPAWPTSPYHGVTDGDGKTIPCLCRFQGTDFRVGDTVCMNTHLGVQLARCDLFLNNTSWVPIGVPCTMSRLDTRRLSLSPSP